MNKTALNIILIATPVLLGGTVVFFILKNKKKKVENAVSKSDAFPGSSSPTSSSKNTIKPVGTVTGSVMGGLVGLNKTKSEILTSGRGGLQTYAGNLTSTRGGLKI